MELSGIHIVFDRGTLEAWDCGWCDRWENGFLLLLYGDYLPFVWFHMYFYIQSSLMFSLIGYVLMVHSWFTHCTEQLVDLCLRGHKSCFHMACLIIEFYQLDYGFMVPIVLSKNMCMMYSYCLVLLTGFTFYSGNSILWMPLNSLHLWHLVTYRVNEA